MGLAEDGTPEQSEFAGWRDIRGIDRAFGDLSDGIEMAHGIDLVAEELDAQRTLAGGWEDIDDAAAKGDFSFLGDLSLGFVTLVFEPFDEVEGVEGFALSELAGAGLEFGRGEGRLHESGDGGRDEGGL